MMLKVEQLVKEYKHCGKTFSAVDKVSFSIPKGQFVVLMGPSGCGKSTLFHILTGLTKPTSGKVYFEEQEITAMDQKKLAKLRSTSIGYILQGHNLLSNFTIGENVCMPAFFGKMEKDTFALAKQLLADFGLEGLENEMPSVLSGGEQRRVAIARTLVHRPKIVIADEPTSNLDEKNVKIILEYFKKISQEGTTVLISSHSSDAMAYGDEIWKMEKGVIIRE